MRDHEKEIELLRQRVGQLRQQMLVEIGKIDQSLVALLPPPQKKPKTDWSKLKDKIK